MNNPPIYQIPGTIYAKYLKKTSSESKHPHLEYYSLQIKSTKFNWPCSLRVFKDKLTNPQIWETLTAAKYGELTNKQFTFFCQNIRGFYYLIDWEELSPEEKEAGP